MSCFNFIIMKVNGADVSNLPYEEAVQLFLNADEPILVEVRRRFFEENNKLNFFNHDIHKSPTLAVISSSNTPNLYEGVDFCRLPGEMLRTTTTIASSEKPAISSISCQTDLSAFDSEFKEKAFMNHDDPESNGGGTLSQRKQTEQHDGGLRTEFDIEEITLAKSQSAENLGFTISYSTEEYSGSDLGSDECIAECKGSDRRDTEYSLHANTNRCKIYVGDIVPNSLADRDGRLHQGDRILQINGQNVLEKVDPNKVLTENRYSVTILVSRYAYAGDDDFLDSAVYCDDKECQDDRHQSSICECEQNTFSSKSSISQSEQKSCTPTTVANIYPILPIAVEKVSDLFNHANIKAQLESVNKEISLLNSQISIMKLQQLQSDNQVSTEKQDKSPVKTRDKPITKPDTEIEHIYETIPEDTESDAYYCSPYESGASDKLRVEQWLKSIGCTRTHSERTRLQKHNPSLDDYDNSSSAYNTGGSCNSGLLALDQQKSKYSSRKLTPSKCKNHQGPSLDKSAIAASGKHEHRATPSQQISSCVNRRTSVQPSTFLPIGSHYPTDVDSDGHSTLVATRSSVYRMCQFKAVEEDNKNEDVSEMVWKVKRREDGSRYIVRRVTKKSLPADKSPDDCVLRPMPQPDTETASAIDHKRQAQKFRERRHRIKHPAATPSKEKHHAQHWLV